MWIIQGLIQWRLADKQHTWGRTMPTHVWVSLSRFSTGWAELLLGRSADIAANRGNCSFCSSQFPYKYKYNARAVQSKAGLMFSRKRIHLLKRLSRQWGGVGGGDGGGSGGGIAARENNFTAFLIAETTLQLSISLLDASPSKYQHDGTLLPKQKTGNTPDDPVKKSFGVCTKSTCQQCRLPIHYS